MIFYTQQPLNFEATNVTVIDYRNINAGFMFEVECNFEGANLVGEIIFDNIK